MNQVSMTRSRYEEMREATIQFHKKHPEVWTLFIKFSFERIQKGYIHYSARGIFQRIRWETDQAKTNESEFKLNDHYSPFYSRRFMKQFPQHNGFFRTRIQTSKNQPPVCLRELGPSDFQ